MSRTILHCDMDMFFAAVEIRDNPELAGKPLIIGALPNERGVVSTCSYEARKYGVRSAMSIKDAYRLCPHGIYMHGNMEKYHQASLLIQEIWSDYSDLIEYISLDECFIDITGSLNLFGGAAKIGREIKERIKNKVNLTCSVGIGYSLMSAKLGSEEKKPDGYFEILTPAALKELIIDRDVRIIYGVGKKTQAELHRLGVHTVRDIYNNRTTVINALGNQGRYIVELADGIDDRVVAAPSKSHSLGKEYTFQKDITDIDYLKDVLRLIAKELSFHIKDSKIYCRTITLKVTFFDMKKITRSKSAEPTNRADDIYHTAASLLDKVEKRPIRLVGISLSGFEDELNKQISFFDSEIITKSDKLNSALHELKIKYGLNVIKTGSELGSEKRLEGKNP
ncbi:MAG: DNA polymerase IV [Lachnospiraceae bacterium]|nr:DNA polymerase IV [Lachnospiraceae bacterium]